MFLYMVSLQGRRSFQASGEREEDYCIVSSLCEKSEKWFHIGGGYAHEKEKPTQSIKKGNPAQKATPIDFCSCHSHRRGDIRRMGERLDIMLPEIMARIAAVEHTLIERRLCSLDEQERF